MFSPEQIATFTFLITLANFIAIIVGVVWSIWRIYAESKLATKRHQIEVAIKNDLELLYRFQTVLRERYDVSIKISLLAEDPDEITVALASFSEDTIELNREATLTEAELTGIAKVIGDSELTKITSKLFTHYLVNQTVPEGDIRSLPEDVKRINAYHSSHTELYSKAFERTYELIRININERTLIK